MSRYGAKTYGRRQENCKSSMQFDQLLSENTNKPSTAKVSVAGVHRWGMATFTSIRKSQVNGTKDGSEGGEDRSKRIKVESKSNDSDPFSFDSEKDNFGGHPTSASSAFSSLPKATNAGVNTKTILPSRPNKFFKSGGSRLSASRNKSADLVDSKLFPSRSNVVAKPVDQQLNINSFIMPLPTIGCVANELGRSFEASGQSLFDCLHRQEDRVEMALPLAPGELSINQPPPSKPYSGGSSSYGLHEADLLSSQLSNSSIEDYGTSQPSNTPASFSRFVPRVSPNRLCTIDSEEANSCDIVCVLEMDDQNHARTSQFQPARTVCATEFSNLSQTLGDYIAPRATADYASEPVCEPDGYSMRQDPVDAQSVQESVTHSAFKTYARGKSKPTVTSQVLKDTSETIRRSVPTQECAVSHTAYEDECLFPQNISHSQPTLQMEETFPDSQESLDLPISQSICSQVSDDFVMPSSQGSGHSISQRKPLLKSKKIFNTPKKLKAVYKVRAWHEDDVEETEISSESEVKTNSLADEFEDELEDENLLTLSKKSNPANRYGERVTSWKCERKVKELYTVVHNVKQAHQVHESGETQEFNDEVEYLLEGVQSTSSLGTRCLSTLGWATKCMVPAFRIHLRAHGTIPQVFSALIDAPSLPSLSLCAATLMFVLSQDRLTMDLDASTLSLLLQLLESAPLPPSSSIPSGDSQSSSSVSNIEDPTNVESTGESKSKMAAHLAISPQQDEKIGEKVRSLCLQMQQKGYAKQLDLTNVTGGNLAMETLLSLSSRRTGEWFKEEIRILGGLDYIVETVRSGADQFCSQFCPEFDLVDSQLDQLRKLDRCLRVIENVTYMNPENQSHIVKFKRKELVTPCISLLKLCQSSLGLSPFEVLPKNQKGHQPESPGALFFSTILTLLKVLFNVTHENVESSTFVGSQDGLLECVLLLLMQSPIHVPLEGRFELLVLCLAFLINLVEHSDDNRDRFVVVHTVGCFDADNSTEDMPVIEALVEMFLNRLELAKLTEEQADALLDGQSQQSNSQTSQSQGEPSSSSSQSAPISSQQSQAEQMEETLMKALQKANKNMEDSIIAAYIALLMGCIIQNLHYADIVREHMPDRNFNLMVEIIRKFLNFVNLTGVVSTTGMKSVQRVLTIIESR